MAGFPASLGGSSGDVFGTYDAFDPDTEPRPGEFLDGHDVLVGDDHLAFHRLSRAVFEERGVYDMTFGYNLARLNLDGRHPDAGYRYAVEDAAATDLPVPDAEETDDEPPTVLRAEFTPTTAFCPQSDTLTKGSFRAWNGLADRHEFDLVRVRVAEMHQQADAINAALADLEAQFCETGTVERMQDRVGGDADPDGSGPAGSTRGYDAPF
jgi:hypothetical protein